MKTIKLYFYGLLSFGYVFVFGIITQMFCLKIDITKNAKKLMNKGGWYE